MISDIADLQRLVRDGFTDWRSLGDVAVKEQDGLLLFNYTPAAQFAGRWNAFELMSRGLILDAKTGTVVARPFNKFFNWGQGGRTTDAPLRHVWEKMDGSLGIGYRWGGEWHVATRGSFDSDQAQWAQERFRRMDWDSDAEDARVTYLFEIIYPDNRIVVDYAGHEGLCLLAIRSNHTGVYFAHRLVDIAAPVLGFERPRRFDMRHVDDITALCADLDANQEGFVAEFEDGSRFKFKGDAYKELHRAISGLTYRRTVEAVANGTVDEVRQVIPDEFLNEFNEWVDEIEQRVATIAETVERRFDAAPQGDRKIFARYVQDEARELAPYLFARLDGKDYRPMIYKREFN